MSSFIRQHLDRGVHRAREGRQRLQRGRLALLDQFYEQWLYGETKPTILPEDFGAAPIAASEAKGASRSAAAGGARR